MHDEDNENIPGKEDNVLLSIPTTWFTSLINVAQM